MPTLCQAQAEGGGKPSARWELPRIEKTALLEAGSVLWCPGPPGALKHLGKRTEERLGYGILGELLSLSNYRELAPASALDSEWQDEYSGVTHLL